MPGRRGEFTIRVDGEPLIERGGNLLTRMFGGGYPDTELVIEHLAERQRRESS